MSYSSLAKFGITYFTLHKKISVPESLSRRATLIYVGDFWKKSHSNICGAFWQSSEFIVLASKPFVFKPSSQI